MRALVVVPTYNEAASVAELVRRALAADGCLQLLVVDDGSPDGTAALVKQVQAGEPRLHLLERTAKQGLGAAYRAGFDWALSRGYDVLLEMDADLSHPPERIPALLDALRTADVAIGSRYVPGGRTVNWSRARAALSRAGNGYVRLALHLPVDDATAGFRAYRRAVLRTVGLETVQSNGYCFQVEMVHRAWQEGFRVAEVPITFTDRATGESKMDGRIVLEALVRVTGWALTGGRRRMHAQHPASVLAGSPTV